jgi:signal recognition particle GTPase
MFTRFWQKIKKIFSFKRKIYTSKNLNLRLEQNFFNLKKKYTLLNEGYFLELENLLIKADISSKITKMLLEEA